MKKIYLIIGGVVILLIILIILINFLSKNKDRASKSTNQLVTPTTVPIDYQSVLDSQPNQSVSNTDNINVYMLKQQTPIETDDFKLVYNETTDKYYVSLHNDLAYDKFNNWAVDNQVNSMISDPNLIEYVTQDDINSVNTQVKPGEVLLNLLNIFLNFGQGGTYNNLNQPESTNRQSESLNQTVYYNQCNEFGDIELPSGCTVCEAGCGPTTVSMIASHYIDTSYTPEKVVNLYKDRNYYLGCSGSRTTDAKAFLSSLGLKTTDYLIYDYESADSVAKDIKKYIDSGWTLFTMARFCDEGCAHFFWVTDVDSNGNILAYDPFYGKYETPFNQNSKSPYPYYRIAFGIKK